MTSEKYVNEREWQKLWKKRKKTCLVSVKTQGSSKKRTNFVNFRNSDVFSTKKTLLKMQESSFASFEQTKSDWFHVYFFTTILICIILKENSRKNAAKNSMVSFLPKLLTSFLENCNLTKSFKRYQGEKSILIRHPENSMGLCFLSTKSFRCILHINGRCFMFFTNTRKYFFYHFSSKVLLIYR